MVYAMDFVWALFMWTLYRDFVCDLYIYFEWSLFISNEHRRARNTTPTPCIFRNIVTPYMLPKNILSQSDCIDFQTSMLKKQLSCAAIFFSWDQRLLEPTNWLSLSAWFWSRMRGFVLTIQIPRFSKLQ